MSKKVFITGAGGFVGHHFLEHVLTTTDWDIVATDSFRHKGKTDRISQVLDGFAANVMSPVLKSARQRTHVLTHDLCAPFTAQQVRKLQAEEISYMVCFASESHVDRSISDPVSFIHNNDAVVLNTLELARKLQPEALIWISTDEVYGPVAADDLKGHKEWASIRPSNPYAASKAAQEALAYSYWRTYGVPAVIVNCMNMIGERQDTEKFVPLVISKVLKGEKVTIHGTPGNIGTRHYLHARNLADALLFLLKSPMTSPPSLYYAHAQDRPNHDTGQPDRYNIASPDRIDNLTLAHMIAEYAGKPLKYELQDFHRTRPGHDPHYGLDASLMTSLGWEMPVPFDESLRRTVEWSVQHPDWLLPD